MKGGTHLALAGRLRQVFLDVERVVRRAEQLLAKTRQTGDDGYLDGAALNLHSFYAGLEAGLEDIARTMDGALPSGPNWHQELLQQMAAELPNLRPAVIRRSTRDCLEEYRAFRHLVRNVYTFNLRPERLAELADGANQCFEAVREDLESFTAFLHALEE